MKKFTKVLVANRGEIAVRIIKALKEMGIPTVAVYSDADKGAPHTRLADECVCLGNSNSQDSYLNTYKILSAATMKGVDAIHPGIGFLAENDRLPDICRRYGIGLIGPGGDIIKLMGNKNTAKKIAAECGLPIIAGSDGPVKHVEECKEIIREIGTPVILKAIHGGGGKGIRVIRNLNQADISFNLCKKEAEASFNECELIVEQFLENTRHVEVQIIGDVYGNVIHLGDRECTIQRLNQKLIEEARSVNIDADVKARLYDEAVRLAKHIKYVGPGTVEFLVLPDGSHYFIEMNTRLQVEHTITELVTGIDIVKQQIRVSSEEKLVIRQSDIHFSGYALECRILAENLEKGFTPSCGKITKMNVPGGLGVRLDSGYSRNDTITPYYDSLIMKLCCYAHDKAEAIKKMRVCLEELEISGIDTNIDFLKFIMSDDNFLTGNYHENYVEEKIISFSNNKF